ncbi:Glycosyltransferase 8 domain-containing protein 1 [Durusdinium trenchii]|uniref:Glycosyltransferase 8 domain-containing protein 1 n=1 Tax=Durusdinium trenchii TaxID=1381693 RepID=A0ABP0K7A8_9DINO
MAQRALQRPPLDAPAVEGSSEGGQRLVEKLLNLVSIKGEDIMVQAQSEEILRYHRLRASLPAALWKWKTITGWHWKGSSEHINVLEMRAVLTTLKWHVSLEVTTSVHTAFEEEVPPCTLDGELFDALNFAAFYLHEALPDAPGGRVLSPGTVKADPLDVIRGGYLDTDVVVTSDLAELASFNLHGFAAGAAEDCSQRMGKYLDFDRMRSKALQSELPKGLQARKKGCVINRGVVLLDLAVWKSQNITGIIEELVRLHLTKGKGPLWRAGVSQPPFLIALAGKYYDLGAEFNVRGLGRGDIAPEEVDFHKKRRQWDPYFDKFLYKCKFHCCPGCKGWALSPYISALAQKAKILHFNGRLKPSHAGKRGLERVATSALLVNNGRCAAVESRVRWTLVAVSAGVKMTCQAAQQCEVQADSSELSCQKHLFSLPEGVISVEEIGHKAVSLKNHPWRIADDGIADQVRAQFARLVHCDAKDVALVPSTSYAISQVYAWQRLCREASARLVAVPRGRVAHLGERWGHRIAVCAVPHFLWTDGSPVDLPHLRKAAISTPGGGCGVETIEPEGDRASSPREPGDHRAFGGSDLAAQLLDDAAGTAASRSLLVVDATQSLGVVPIHVKDWKIDWLVPMAAEVYAEPACSVHKWLFGPYGLSLAARSGPRARPSLKTKQLTFVSHSRMQREVYASEEWSNDAKTEPIVQDEHNRLGADGDVCLAFDLARPGYSETFQNGAKKFDAGGRMNPILLPMVAGALEQALRGSGAAGRSKLGASK